MEVMCSKLYIIHYNLLTVTVWTKRNDGTEAKGNPVLRLPLSSVQPVHSKHSACTVTLKLS